MNITPVSKTTITVTPKEKTPNLTWDEADMTWDESQGTWDNAINPVNLPTKNTITLTLHPKV